MALCGHDIVGDDPRSPLEFRLCGRLGCRGGGLALVPVRLCRTHFQTLNDTATPFQAGGPSIRCALLCRHCCCRRAGSRWLDCTDTISLRGKTHLRSRPGCETLARGLRWQGLSSVYCSGFGASSAFSFARATICRCPGRLASAPQLTWPSAFYIGSVG